MTAGITMAAKVKDYLVERRHAGFALAIDGKRLARFAKFTDATGYRGPLTIEIASQWALATRSGRRITSARRIETLRSFARYCRSLDGKSEIPPLRLFGPGHRRLTPHIYTTAEIQFLQRASLRLHPAGGLRGHTCATIIGLLAACGLRISEATALSRDDVDLTSGCLHIRKTKYGKARTVPLHSTTVTALRRYARRRDRDPASAGLPAFFIFDNGISAHTMKIHYAFRILRRQFRHRPRGGHPLHRLHDLRHAFVCRRLQRWYQEGLDFDHQLLALSTYIGHVGPSETYWYVTATPQLMAIAATFGATFGRRCVMSLQPKTPLAPLLRQFFVERLHQQRQASPRTISAYRDAFRLLLIYVHGKLRKRPADLAIQDLDTALILGFLEHLEKQRKNSIRSRNARFAAIRSFMQYVSFKEPAVSGLARSILAIPMKRFDRRQVGFLTREHVQAIIDAPDASRWAGRRDRVLLATLYNTGARVSELINIQVEDLMLGSSPAVRLHGKGRKDRSVPLWATTAAQLRQWLREQPHTRSSPVFPKIDPDRL